MVLGQQINRAIVVGRGPSVNGSLLSTWIDSDGCTVVRMSNGLYGRDHGVKTDILVVTCNEIVTLKRGRVPQTVWFYRTRGRGPALSENEWLEYDPVIRRATGDDVSVVHINRIIEPWLEEYRRTARPLNQKHHPHVTYPSKGTAAALATMALLKPRSIYLLGMDNVVKGERIYHCHDFNAERAVLELASDRLNVSVAALMPPW